MKNLNKKQNAGKILFFICLILGSNSLISQWTAQTSGTTNQLNSISFFDANSGICVGNQVILKTPSGGSSWGLTSSATNLKSVHYVASDLAFCTGQSAVYKWTSATGWVAVGGSLGASIESYVIYFPTSTTGYVLAENLGAGRLFKTTNAGNNWSLQYSFTGVFYGMKFQDASTGFVCGSSKRVMKTTDGGVTFTPSLNLGGTENFRSIDIANINNSGFTAGDDGVRYSTTNNGTTWTPVSGSSLYQYKAAAVWSNGSSVVLAAVGVAAPFFLISASNTNGSTWAGQAPSGNGTFNGVCNGQNAWTFYACGNNGVIYKTTNAGGNFVGIQNTSKFAERYSLSQNYPNPFNPVTVISFDIPEQSFTKLAIYDLLGREVTSLVNEQLLPGNYKVTFDAGNIGSGVYFYKIEAGAYTETKRMTLVK